MRHALTIAAALAMAASFTVPASAQKLDDNGRCHAKDGKFAKAEVCAGLGRKGSVLGPTTGGMMAGKRCKNDTGKFAKCGSPGAHPA
jgi:hypothetical protein